MAKDPTSEFASAEAAVQAGEGAIAPTTGFFGHPRGLATLFFTELWERFSYYGMRALLILFMTASVAEGGLGFDTVQAGAVYGLYTAFVYMLALPGGWVADRLIGQRRAVLIGGIIIAAGHFSMAVDSLTTFYLGLGLIVIGTGLLKPNISAMVGELYRDEEDGARRDAGFSIFYMGINIGAFIAPLVCGWLGEGYDWHLGFGAAGVGMVLGIIQYVMGGRHLGEAGLYPERGDDATYARNRRNFVIGIVAVMAVGIMLFVQRVPVETIAGWGTALILTMTGLYFAYVLGFGGLDPDEKKRVSVIGILFLAAAVFWSGFEQAGSSLNLVAERLTNRVIGGTEVPASVLQSINPLFIIAMAPVFAWLWVWLSRRGKEPSAPAKFAAGLILLGAGFAVMIMAASLAATGRQISPMWLVVTYFLHTSGELALSPVGLSTMTKLSPKRLVGQMMGIWFMAAALGNLIAGQIAGRIGAGEAAAAGEISADAAAQIFTTVTMVTIGFGLVLMLFVKPIRKLMGRVH